MTEPTHNPVERWGRFEVALSGPQEGNPFLYVQFGAVFTHKHRAIAVDGYYDGDGVYRARFMPDTLGELAIELRMTAGDLRAANRYTMAVTLPPD